MEKLINKRCLPNQIKIQQYTGAAILLIALIAMYIMPTLILPLFNRDVELLNQLETSLSFYYVGIVLWLLISFLDVFIGWGLFQIYQSKDGKRAKNMYTFRVIYALILIVGVGYLIKGVFENSVLNSVLQFQWIWRFGLIIFGFHLISLSKFLGSNIVQKIFKFLLYVAGIGYVIVSISFNFFPQFNQITTIFENIFMLPMFVGEVSFGIWLLLGKNKI